MKLLKILALLIWMVGLLSCKDSSRVDSKLESQDILRTELAGSSLYALLIAKKDTVVLEEYFNDKSNKSLCDVQSLTKGLVSMLVGIAIDKGHIDGVDETIDTYFPEEYDHLSDTRKRGVKIEHLLNQTSGLDWKGYLEHEDWIKDESQIQYVLKKTLNHEPGEFYNYNSGATHLLSVIISRSTGQSTLEFANEVLFDELDIGSLHWEVRNDGYHDGSGLGLQMRPSDLMKLGQLLQQKGYWGQTQIVSEEWISNLFDSKKKSATKWGLRKSTHGYCWYKAELNGDTIDYGMGYGGQFILMIPQKELIIVTAHNHDTPDGIDQQVGFLKRTLPQLISKYGDGSWVR